MEKCKKKLRTLDFFQKVRIFAPLNSESSVVIEIRNKEIES
jgi:predicted DNA-binding protein (UPF0251 family)